MKTKWFISTSLIFALFATVVKGFTIDGTASTGEYPATGQPLAVQTLGSNASATNPTNGDVAVSSGSQLDAAYGVVSNGTLYLLLAGNMKSDVADLPGNGYDKLSVFIDTGAPGQNTLGPNNLFDVDQPSAIRRMSAGGDSNNCPACPGLTFDTGFNASYWIGFSYGNGTNPTLYVNYATLPAAGGGFGNFSGSVTPGTTNSAVANGIHAAMNNSNIGGVDTNLCNVNTNGAAQSIAAALVKTGVELSISLNDIGGPNAVGPFKVVAFLSTNDYTQIYDQLLGPDSAACVDASAIGDPLTNNFSTLPGAPHYFTLPVVGCNYTISPFDAFYTSTGGSGSISVGAIGGTCGWSVTSSVPWLVITSPINNSGPGTITYTVAANPSTAVKVGTITLTGTLNGQDVFTVTEGGQNLSKDFVVDGSRDPAYGCPVAIQNIGTGYGNSTNGTVMPTGSGSELDCAYGMVENNTLFLLFAGNMEGNGNKLMVFFDTGLGGSSVLSSNQSGIEGNNLNKMGTQTNNPTAFPGFTFDTGFSPRYWLGLNVSGGTFFADYAQLWPGGTNSSGVATNGYFLGRNGGTNGVLTTGTNPFSVQATINNSNTNGVGGGNCGTNAAAGLQSVDAATVTNGVEVGIPLAALGNPTGIIKVCAMVTAGNVDFGMSNQLLGPLGTNDPTILSTYCQGNPGGTNISAISLTNFPGQHYFVVGPEARITSIALVNGTNVMIGYQTAANTNLTYQLQKIAPPGQYTTNTSAWVNKGGLNLGNGGIVTFTDTQGSPGTNKPGAFYRVRQTPLCP